jgi:hypothetical protein
LSELQEFPIELSFLCPAPPHSFNELLPVVPGLSDRPLTEGLRELERESIVRRMGRRRNEKTRHAPKPSWPKAVLRQNHVCLEMIDFSACR